MMLFRVVTLTVSILCVSSIRKIPLRLDTITLSKCNSKLEQTDTVLYELLNVYQLEKDKLSPCPCLNSTHWMNAAYLNMTHPSQQCPSNWSINTEQVRGYSKMTPGAGCDSVHYSTEGLR